MHGGKGASIATKGACALLMLVVLGTLAVVSDHRDGERRGVVRGQAALHPGIAGDAVNASLEQTLDRKLAPGESQPVNLMLRNPNSHPLTVTRLTLRVQGMHAPRATVARPCGVADFFVNRFSGPYGFTVPASSTLSLSQLGVPPARWPRVGMHDTPLNQDGCKEAELTFAFTAAGTAPTG